jgi:putative glutamine amidotransferase
VLLPPQPVTPDIAARMLESLDGLILTGGADVDPARYGREPHPRTDKPREDRDTWEDTLLSTAIELELPFLGICRGAQLLNVTRGGTLHQHLPEVVGHEKYQLGSGAYNQVPVDVGADSTLHELVGDSVSAEVYHHQAIDKLGDGLRVTARTAEGVIEAVELDGVPFGIAVQWHPEESQDDLRLFAGLVEAARTYHVARERGGAAK